MIIAIDCDLVLADLARIWLMDLSMRYKPTEDGLEALKNHENTGAELPYDLTSLFDIPKEDDPASFWKNSRIYNGIKPIEGSVEYTKKLKEDGHTLVCVSRVVGDHSSNKCKWIKKWFPHFDAIFLTGEKLIEKTLVRCDVIIEDSLKQLNAFDNSVYRLHYQTDYYQEGVVPNEGIIPVCNWEEVYGTISSLQDIKRINAIRLEHGFVG